MDMESTTARTHVNNSWAHGVLFVEETRVFQACAVVNVMTGESVQIPVQRLSHSGAL